MATRNHLDSHLVARSTLPILLVLCISDVRAEFVVLDNFDELVAGPIDGQNDWEVVGLGGEVVTLPTNSTNQALELDVTSGVVRKGAVIPNGDTRMLFMKFSFDGQHTYSFGMSQVFSPAEFVDFGPELRRASALNLLEIHNGQTYDVLAALEPRVWYNVWANIDNDSGNTQVWMHSREGDGALASDQLDADGQIEFDFRSDYNTDLVNFFIKAADGGSGTGLLWIDDIYLENSDSLNLSNPTALLLGDYNRNDVVDIADYTVWRNRLGSVVSLPNDDTPGVGQDDYDRWKSHFGETRAITFAAQVAMASVPEPTTIGITLLGILAVLLRHLGRNAAPV